MRQGFRPSLEPPKHRKAVVEARRPFLCSILTAIVIVLVFAIFGLSAWNVYEHRFNQNLQHFHPKDEVSLSEVGNDLSATFCDGYTVSVYGPGHVFLLPSHATVDTSSWTSTPVIMHQMPFEMFNIKSYYLLVGSIVEVIACRDRGAGGPGASIVLIRGDSNLQEWRKNSECRDCIVERVEILWNDICESTRDWQGRSQVSRHATLNHKVNKNDMYFLVIYYGRPEANRHQMSGMIKLWGEINRTHFDVAHAESDCYAAACQFDLPWMSHKDVVVRIDDGFFTSRRNVTTQCQARVVFWVGIFGLIPVVAVIPVALVFAWFLCRRTQRNAKVLRENQERRRIRQNDAVSNKGRMNYVDQNEDYGSVAIQEG